MFAGQSLDPQLPKTNHPRPSPAGEALKPILIALPCVAVLLGAGLWLLSGGRRPTPVQIPEHAHETGPEPQAAHAVLEISPEEVAALHRSRTRPPERKPPPRPALEPKPALAVSWRLSRIEYKNGECREEYEVIHDANTADCSAVVSAISKGARAEGPTYILASYRSGVVPDTGSEFDVFDAPKNFICRTKLVRVYHINDDPDLPIEELGLQTIDLPAGAEVEKGFTLEAAGSMEVKHGYWRAWYPDGVAAAEGRYEKGKRSGEWTFWHRNGSVRAIGFFMDDLPIDTWRWWFDDGSRQAEWTESDLSNEFGGWQAWLPGGELHPCFDTTIMRPIAQAANDINQRRYAQAASQLQAARGLLENCVESNARDGMSAKLQVVEDKLELILNSNDPEFQAGQRRLLKFIDMKELLDLTQSHKLPIPPRVFAPN